MTMYVTEYIITKGNQPDLVFTFERHLSESTSQIELYVSVKDNYLYIGAFLLNIYEIDMYFPGWNIYRKGSENPIGEVKVEYFTKSMVIKYCVFEKKYRRQLMKLIDLIHSDLSFIGFTIAPRFEVQKRIPKKDAIERVAVALFFIKKGEYKTRSATAKRTHTSIQTIRNLEDNEEVKKLIAKFTENITLAYTYRQKYKEKRRKREDN
jgi:hypothetical protein